MPCLPYHIIEVGTKIDADSQQGSKMQGRIKKKLRFPETEEVLKENKVPWAAYGKKLSQPLDDPQKGACDIIHAKTSIMIIKVIFLFYIA